MATIKTQNGGKIVLRDGKVQCACCVLFEFPIEIGEPGDCACSNPDMRCFGPQFPAPNPYKGDIEVHAGNSNQQVRLQGPIQDENGIVTGWNSLVDNPTVVNLLGLIGGDVVVIAYKSEFAPQEPNPAAPEFEVTAQEGEFDCGICVKPRNSLCSLFYSWVMYPNVVYELQFVTYHYLADGRVCNALFRGSLFGGGAAPAP